MNDTIDGIDKDKDIEPIDYTTNSIPMPEGIQPIVSNTAIDILYRRDLKRDITLLCIIIVTMACSFWIFHQFIDWKYKAQLLQEPCSLCEELNPHFSVCLSRESERIKQEIQNKNTNNIIQDVNLSVFLEGK